MSKKSKAVRGKESLQWTPSMDAIFIEAMLYEENQGNRCDGTFTSASYTNMLDFLNRKLEIPNLKKEHLKNRLRTLKENFRECYDLFNNKSSLGFTWNPVTKLWTAEVEVWKTFLESHPAAARWMTKPIHNYDALKELFANDRTTVEGIGNAKKKRKQSAELNENEVIVDENDNLLCRNFISSEHLVDLDVSEEDTPIPIPKGEAQSHSGAASEEMKTGVSNTNTEEQPFLSAIEKFANMINESNRQMINAFTRATETMANAISSSQQRTYAPSEIYTELLQMKLDQPFLDEAYFWLADNEKMVRLLFGFPAERRKDALERMMNKGKSCSKGTI
ncbi:hypothetical protein POM88_005474 [Heracleum sosnowskyi]|uniref:Myb/SANT-like domain-containing protein n=1 Tax=Heracleum sosnowskyi TaxID=360622 RepID=A0AAD8N4I4_9APIA|nr:hypothetical protein POM88_005474 [Heracleum sosnowskyi]